MELKRSAHLVLYWRDDELVLHNYAVDRTVAAQPLLIEVLEQFRTWKLLEHYLDSVSANAREALFGLIQLMTRDRWLWQRGEPLLARECAMSAWGAWNPAAGFFHVATKDAEIVGLDDLLPRLRVKAVSSPMPPPVKTYPDAARVPLPRPSTRGSFARVLRDRRTWRRFGSEPVELTSLATLLDLSAGIQEWVDAEGEGPVPLKTSPSGGARHPIEVYVAARHIRDLAPGVYHFASARHELERLSTAVLPFDQLLPEQWWYRDAAAVVLFTAVFERTRWRYQGPRAYRAVLLEAGHVCQTFCLTATWLGLAPFCSMALADSTIERALNIDGVSESVLYAAGVGSRPRLPDGELPGMLPMQGPTEEDAG